MTKKKVAQLSDIGDPYKILSFFKTFDKLTVKVEMNDEGKVDLRNDFLESCVSNISLEQCYMIKEEKGISEGGK